MKRLLHVVSFTTDLDTARRFYRDAMGLKLCADTPFMVNFSHDGAGLMLLAVQPTQRREVELCFEAERVSAVVESLRVRGVEFIDELRHLAFGSVIHFRDPEGNLLSLLQPGSGATLTSAERKAQATGRHGIVKDAGQLALALTETTSTVRSGPVMTTVMVRVQDMVAARGYFGRLLGLKETVNSPLWVQYDTGDVQLVIHRRPEREGDHYMTSPVSFGFSVEDLDEWVAAGRSRGVEVTAVSASHGLGAAAAIRDPEGNLVVVREYVTDAALQKLLDRARAKTGSAATSKAKAASATKRALGKATASEPKSAGRANRASAKGVVTKRATVARRNSAKQRPGATSAAAKRPSAKPAAPRAASRARKPQRGA